MKKVIRVFMFIIMIASYFFYIYFLFLLSMQLLLVWKQRLQKSFNIRIGPGTNYLSIGGTTIGQSVSINQYAKTDDGSSGW